MEETKNATGCTNRKGLLVLVLALLVAYLWLTRYEFLVIPPGGKGEYGILVRVHKYAGTAEIALPLSREWKYVIDDTQPPAAAR